MQCLCAWIELIYSFYSIYMVTVGVREVFFSGLKLAIILNPFSSTPNVLLHTADVNLGVEYSRIAPSQLFRQRIASTHSHVVQE